MSKLKSQLIKELQKQLQVNIDAYADSLLSIKDSKANETKSSVGDKFETGRAMLQAEEAKLENHLAICQNQMQLIGQIKLDKIHNKVEFGSMVITNENTFFICIPFNKITLENKPIYFVSPQSPIAKSIIGKSVGDKINFNGKEITVKSIF